MFRVGPEVEDPAVAEYLARLGRTRIRLLYWPIAFALLLALSVSESAGVPLTTIRFTLVREYLSFRSVGWIGALWTMAMPITSLLTAWQTARPMFFLGFLEMLLSMLQVSTRWTAVTTSVIFAAWIPLCLRDGGNDAALQVLTMLAAASITIILNVVHRRSQVDAERGRLEERRVSEALTRELAERRRAEQEREKAEAERALIQDQFIHAQRMEAVGTLAAGVAHDMNNILAGILSTADLIREETDDSWLREDCTRIVEEAERGAVLTRSLLAFSRRGQYRREVVPLSAVIDSIRPLLTRTLPKGLNLVVTTGEDQTVNADRVQMGQAIVNLCINGADAMEGMGDLTVTTRPYLVTDAALAARIGLHMNKRYAVVSITDTGHGMDAATQKRIFEPFFTTKPQGKGTGLGLAMVYGSVKGHDGAIDVVTAPGQGTEFRIYLPEVDAIPHAIPARPDTARIRARGMALVVDDEPMVQRATTRQLERMGMTVITAPDGETALRLHEEHRDQIELVVLDMGMPGMGGPACFRELRESSRVPILICSGYALADDTQQLLRQGPAGFLEKPFTNAQITEYVDRLVST